MYLQERSGAYKCRVIVVYRGGLLGRGPNISDIIYKKKVEIISDKLHAYLMCYKIRRNLFKDPSILMNKLRGDTDCGCNEQILLFRIKEVGIR